MTLAERFWAKVNKTDDCWNWTASTNWAGYGKISVSAGRWKTAHRISWEMENGLIPTGLSVLHRCDNPKCAKPDHLFLGDQKDNMRDMHRKGRGQRGATHWTALSSEKRFLGERNPLALLTADAVRQIRELRGKLSQPSIAKMFGVSRGAISNVLYGATWSHVR